jgi:hypothetical protein
VEGIINLIYFEYEKFKKWIGTALSWLAGQARRCVEDRQGGADNPQNDLPIDAVAALNEGVPTGFRS